jgi:3-hydroxybutyrate dehydrogenase
MLANKTALVTGSTSGIGLGIAKALARQGANIVLNGFGDAEGPKAEVNNAGIQHVARVEDFPVERWDAVIAINLSSAFHASRLALPAMLKSNWGRIINVASVHGLVGSAEKSAYVAAKHGIVGLTKVTALENATTGVTCNAICPGWVLTPLVQKQVDAKAAAQGISNTDATKQLLGEKEPSMQFTTPEELGELAVFFCSAAGNNVRGVAWNMDGGWAAQ